MAISPLPLTGSSNFQNLNRSIENNGMNNHNPQHPHQASVTSITDNLQAVKESSLLYQLVSRLLLSPEQDKQLSDSLQKTTDVESIEPSNSNSELEISPDIQISANSEQFNLKIEISMLRVEQQTLTITNQFGSFTQQTTVVEAFSMSIEISIGNEQIEESDPLIIDVNGDGFTTTGIEQGAIFDINADGKLDQVSMASADDAFLAMDINGNGMIDDGSELFGDQTGYDNGFAYLASFDDNQDGVIDKNDHIFNSLLMMRLVDNKQFINELSETNIQSINLGYHESTDSTASGDRIVQISDYQKSEGQTGVVADLLLKYRSGIKVT